jgi:hypothetical protein
MGKLMSGARSPKGRLAINLESLLLHGDEGPIEQYKQREIKERAESKMRKCMKGEVINIIGDEFRCQLILHKFTCILSFFFVFCW